MLGEKQKEIISAATVLLFAFLLSAALFSAPFDESGYAAATRIADGKAATPSDMFLSLKASFIGMRDALHFLPPSLLAISSLFLYLALRSRAIERQVAGAAALLFASSASVFVPFLPGVWQDFSLSIPLLAIGIFLFWKSKIEKEGADALFGASALLFLAATYVYPAAGFAAALFVLVHIIELYHTKRHKNESLYALGGLAIVCAGAAFFLGAAGSTVPIMNIFVEQRFLLGLSGISAIFALRNFSQNEDALCALLFLASFPLFIFFPAGSAMLNATSAAFGIRSLLSFHNKTRSEWAGVLFIFFFFFIFGFLGTAEASKSAIISACVSGGLVLAAYLYEFKAKEFPFGALCLLMLLSLFYAVSYSLAPSAGGFSSFHYSAPTVAQQEAFAWLSKNVPSGSTIAVIEHPNAAKFESGMSVFENANATASQLAASAPIAQVPSGTYLAVGPEVFWRPDRIAALSGSDFTAQGFRFFSKQKSTTGDVAIFESYDGMKLLRAIDTAGGFAQADSLLVDSRGAPLAQISYSEVLQLYPEMFYSDPQNLQVRPVQSYNTIAFRMFFGEPEGFEKVYDEGGVRIFRKTA